MSFPSQSLQSLLKGRHAHGSVARMKPVLGISQEHCSLAIATKPHSDYLREYVTPSEARGIYHSGPTL